MYIYVVVIFVLFMHDVLNMFGKTHLYLIYALEAGNRRAHSKTLLNAIYFVCFFSRWEHGGIIYYNKNAFLSSCQTTGFFVKNCDVMEGVLLVEALLPKKTVQHYMYQPLLLPQV